MNEVLWSPNSARVESSRMALFLNRIRDKYDSNLSTYSDLHTWSVKNKEDFWKEIFSEFDLVYEGDLNPALLEDNFQNYTWFSKIKLNFAENLLKHRESGQVALSALHESGSKKEYSFKDLSDETGRFANSLKDIVKEGDVLACYMPNISETIISMLGVSALGGTFTSTSSDFGIEGVLDRFGQSKPKVLVAAAGYSYNGKYFDLLPKISELEKKLDSVEKIIIVDFLEKKPDISNIKKAVFWNDFLSDDTNLEFQRVSFHHPQYIMYSSGTTGKPKCIVHTVGGTLLQHVKELGLHTNSREDKTLFYFTTCGWMMWNWLVSNLVLGGKTVIFEGSPGYPSLKDFFKIVDDEKINFFGTSPKFLRALEDSGYKNDLPLTSLETILSTGAPLLPEQFDFVYSSVKKDIQIASICGGTDIIGCFMLGNPMSNVIRGEIQSLGLGMDVGCFNDDGSEVFGKEGELVCKQTFPSRPLGFLNDPKNEKINDAYFNHYKDVWHHGDFIQVTPEKGVIVYGRSDATLNPGGVRIGTSEIYRQTETLNFIEDSLCVGRPHDGDVEVILFLKLKEGEDLDEERVKGIKTSIRSKTTPRHVPAHIYKVSDIPYTRSGKKMELAITRILAGKKLTNIEAVSNPDCLKEYEAYKS